MNPRYLWLALLGFLSPGMGQAGEPPTQVAIKAAAVKSLALLEKTAEEFTVHRDCFSCHHQALPVMALTMAKEKGLSFRPEVLTHQIQHTARFFDNNRKKFLDNAGTGGAVDTAGYGLLTLHVGGYLADETTDAVIGYLLHRIKDNNHFGCSSDRPPSEVSSVTTTFLGLNALKQYGTKARQKEIGEATQKIEKWLQTRRLRDTEDLVFQLKCQKLLKPEDPASASTVRNLLRLQREDGGWPQNDWRESDAYATGSALFTLRQVGALKPDDPVYQRALKWLVKEQLSDGSWKVDSWSKPFQTYFESGFPHGKDQWISCTGTAWATMALMQALEDGKK